MQVPTIPQQPTPYPMTHLAGSPIANLGYHYPNQSPPAAGSFGNTGFPPSGYGNLGQGSRQIPAGSFVGTKSVEQLNKGIYYLPTHQHIETGAKDILTTDNKQYEYLSSQHAIGVQSGYSQIEYIPYQCYYIDYEQRQFIQNIRVPVQKRVTDYYAVEHVIDYVPKEIQQTVVEMVPQERTSNKLFYVPIQTQLVHMPQDPPTQKTQIKQQVSTTNITNTQERIISRPVQQVQVQQVQVQQPVQQVQQVQQQVVQQVVQQPAQVQQVQVQQLPQGAVLTQQRIQKQIYQNFPAPQQQVVQQQLPPQVIAQRTVQSTQPVTTTQITQAQTQRLPTAPTQQPIPPQLLGQGQFIENAQVLQANQAELLKKYQVPDNAKVNYQYSTKTVRTLSPDELAKMGIQARTTTQQVSSTQPVVTQVSANKTTAATTLAPPSGNSNTLMRNNQVDLADSEHIDITKSTFNKFYGSSNQNQTLGTSNQASYAVNKNQSSFSFADQNGGTFTSINQSAGFKNTGLEAQPNRISGGSVYDYDQYRKDY